jgi:hypothetical protein
VRQFMSGDPDGPSPFHYPAPELIGQFLGDAAAPPSGGGA